MLDAEQVVEISGHPVGGVCPFGLASPLLVYCDMSLRAYDQVVPAPGEANAAVRAPNGATLPRCRTCGGCNNRLTAMSGSAKAQ